MMTKRRAGNIMATGIRLLCLTGQQVGPFNQKFCVHSCRSVCVTTDLPLCLSALLLSVTCVLLVGLHQR